MASHVAFWAEAVEGFVVSVWRQQALPAGWMFGSGYLPGDEPWPHFQVHNAREAAWAREQSATAVLERLDEAHRRLVRFLGTVTDEEIARDPQYWRDVLGHFREHLDELRGKEQHRPTPDSLIEAVNETWRPFHAAVDRLAPDELERKTSSGWSAKELLSHIAFWDEAAVGAIIGMIRRQPMPPGWGFGSGYVPGPGPWPTADVHNAREAEWARGQPAGAVLSRLERSHAGLLEVLRTVTPAEIERDPGYFAHRGHHYVEHLAELKSLH
jgi:hypothetical protein